MVRSDGAEARKERIQEIIRRVVAKLNQGEQVILSKTISEMEYEFGLTKQTVKEYLEIGHNIDRFKIDEKNDGIKKASES
jgi:hypothetical protein